MLDFIKKMQYFKDKINAAIDGRVRFSLSTVFIDLISNICTHNCIFCDGQRYYTKPNQFSRSRLFKMVDEFKKLNVNSVIIVGEGGESLLNKNFVEFAQKLISYNIHLGLYTNGSVYNKKIENVISKFDFIRFSLDSGCAKTHQKIHGYRNRNDFKNIFKFISNLRKINKNLKIGTSFTLLKENVDEIYKAAKLVKLYGGNYLEIKPMYYKNYFLNTEEIKNNLIKLKQQIKKCKKITTPQFKIVLNNELKMFLTNPDKFITMLHSKISTPCLTSRLRMVVSPSGCYLCPPKRGQKEYCFGDPQKKSLINIWNSKQHFKIMNKSCNLKCPYYNQNVFMLNLKNQKLKFNPNNYVFKNRIPEQKYFL
jgi:MoaA/NifB/PqqE/SkfB family radical SAM enzyme